MTIKQKAFLAAYAETGCITTAAKMAKVGRRSHGDWKLQPEYAAAFEVAQQHAIEVLLDEAWRRAHDGVVRYVVHKGLLVYEPKRDKKTGEVLRHTDPDSPLFGQPILSDNPIVERQYSDSLLMFLVKARRPEYRDNWEGNLKVTGSLDLVERLNAARTRLKENF